jgi:hypothetical protein
MKKNKPQNINNHSIQLRTTNKCESLRQAGTEGNARHEGEDPTAPPIFVAGITNLQRLTAITEQVVNMLNYTLKRIISDTIKIKANWTTTE